ncbi:MAG: preprotein translocase subunit YajC [Clostridiales bacterium]|jgi:preprotein translocase subunit YajC|nr:preprotein translocase subunit YajC [Clostridiales bacterium]
MFPILLTTGADTTGMLGSLLLFVPVLALMYFMMIRPQKKKEKQQQAMRNSLEIGDSVTTIGGIVGRVVALKEDTVVLETANERNKIRFKRWAVQEVEKLTME